MSIVAGSGHDATVAADASPKGVSGTVSVVVGGGELLVDAADDGIGSDGVVSIAGEALTLAAGDDGVHGDQALQISDGTLDITSSVEGLEAGLITIVGGDISVVASDDGVNASDPNATGEQAPGAAASTDVGLVISGGTIVVDSGGDGLDANGFLTMTGGTAVVSGPTNDGNGALDVDGTFDVSGGTLLAAGASGMAMTPGADSAQSFVALTFDSTQSAGTVAHVLDADGTGGPRRVRVGEGLLVAGLRVGGHRRGSDVLSRDGRLGHRRHGRRPRAGRRQHRHDGRDHGHDGRRGDRRDGRRRVAGGPAGGGGPGRRPDLFGQPDMVAVSTSMTTPMSGSPAGSAANQP